MQTRIQFLLLAVERYVITAMFTSLLWVASFDGPCAFLATLLILYFCCVLFKRCCYMENKLSLYYVTLLLLFITSE